MNDDYKQDELIEVKLPRSELERLRKILAREKAYDWFTSSIKHNWLFIVGGGILTIWAVYDKILGVIK